MLKPQIPPDEARRLQALQDLKILDTPPEERFDRITRLAARLFSVPVAYISLVDKDRQWFKSKLGLTIPQTPREISFCGHAILSDEAFVVPDARADERFRDNPLVTGDANVRFYAGIPLRAANGSRVGTLCLVDRQPRRFDPPDEAMLRDLATIVEEELRSTRLREAAKLLRETEERMQAVLDNTSAVIFIKDFEGKYILVNHHFEVLFHLSKEQVVGKTDYDIFSPEFAEKFRQNDLEVIRTGQPIRIEEQAPHDDGVHTYLSTKFLMNTPAGVPYAVCGLAYDITDRKIMEEELRQRAALQRAILDSTNVTIISTGPDGIIRTFNRAAEKKLGYLRDEVIGKTTTELFHDHTEVERRAVELAQELRS
ncbi:MAG TPA: PAS domain S-box protein, partial [Acidobacteriota bacterium]|nr:PAS domain S-box protein [Acidobacteriota bacterium]